MVPMELEGRKVLVVGLGASGVSAASFLLRRGARVTLNDSRDTAALGGEIQELVGKGARLVAGGHPESTFTRADLIVLSPGVPGDLPALVAAREAGVEIVGELELAARHIDAPIVAITGTNGKSTTTTFIGQLLRGVGKRVFVGGNLGTPLIEAVDGDHDVVVAEVSSFQLETATTFRPHVALLLNITEDHLDRYPNFDAYAHTKGRIFNRMGPGDFAIVNQRDPLTLREVEDNSAKVYSFSSSGPVERGVWLDGDVLQVGETGRWTPIPLTDFKPRGVHNRENLMAALLATHLSGVNLPRLVGGIPRLEGLPHRLEPAGEVAGVRYYNDSKATNVASVVVSLSGLTEHFVVLLGGRDKGGSYAPLLPLLQARGRGIIIYGEAKPQLRKALGEHVPLHEVENLGQAVAVASQLAQPGDSVVLSPACSSFDQFANYKERGQHFKECVARLAAGMPVQGEGV